MTDIFSYPGETNPNDIKASDPTVPRVVLQSYSYVASAGVLVGGAFPELRKVFMTPIAGVIYGGVSSELRSVSFISSGGDLYGGAFAIFTSTKGSSTSTPAVSSVANILRGPSKPVIPQIRTFAHVQSAMNNLRQYYKGIPGGPVIPSVKTIDDVKTGLNNMRSYYSEIAGSPVIPSVKNFKDAQSALNNVRSAAKV